MGQQIATARLAAVIFFVLTIAIVVLWFFAGQATWAIAILPIWFRIFNAQSSVLFWGLAGQLLNIRQAKRLYGIIGTGDNISRVAGYGVVPLLTP
ncbi:MAG: hypothetical protein Fur005_38360 [Roseiflexaceae bacterium]